MQSDELFRQHTFRELTKGDLILVFDQLRDVEKGIISFETFTKENNININEHMEIRGDKEILSLDYFRECFLLSLKRNNIKLNVRQAQNICHTLDHKEFFCDTHRLSDCEDYIVCIKTFMKKGVLNIKMFKPGTQSLNQPTIQSNIMEGVNISLNKIPAFQFYKGNLELPLISKIITTKKIQDLKNLINDSLNYINEKRIFHLHSTTGKGKHLQCLQFINIFISSEKINLKCFTIIVTTIQSQFGTVFKTECIKNGRVRAFST
jgi:hypothetical protein